MLGRRDPVGILACRLARARADARYLRGASMRGAHPDRELARIRRRARRLARDLGRMPGGYHSPRVHRARVLAFALARVFAMMVSYEPGLRYRDDARAGTRAHLARMGQALVETLDSIAVDASDADLSRLRRLDRWDFDPVWLVGLTWTARTAMPMRIQDKLATQSVVVSRGVYRVTPFPHTLRP
ncbi:MAG: hypothetical protein HOY71_25375 [Nonomuraea sp.]|nr:hypothetical protein [Nonomuraea sp.]